MPSNIEVLRRAIHDAARQAFEAVRTHHPLEDFYYFALVTTEEALRPGPSASSVQGLERTVKQYAGDGTGVTAADLRWSEADSPYNLYGDEFFGEVDRLFVEDGDHRHWPAEQFEAEVGIRFAAMELALGDLDRSGFFGTGAARQAVVINVVAPGDEDESSIIARARRLNPPGSLQQLLADFGS